MRPVVNLGSSSGTPGSNFVDVENSLSRLKIAGYVSNENESNGLRQYYVPGTDIPLTYGDRGSSFPDEQFSRFQSFTNAGIHLKTYEDPPSVLNRYVDPFIQQ